MMSPGKSHNRAKRAGNRKESIEPETVGRDFPTRGHFT
jgi:hypothetical protein